LRPQVNPSTTKALSSGRVARIFVKDGQYVTKSSPILQVELKPLKDQIDSLQTKRATFYYQIRTLSNLLGYKYTLPNPQPQMPYHQIRRIEQATNGLISSQAAKIRQTNVSITQAETKYQYLSRSIAIQRSILARLSKLKASGAISEVQFLENDLKLKGLVSEYSSTLQEKQRLLALKDQYISDFQTRASDLFRDFTEGFKSTSAELEKASELYSNNVYVAPINGYVFKLSPGLVGVPVTAGEEIFQIVPTLDLGATIDVPAASIGFIRVGQRADLHIDSFPSSTYGIIDSKVISIAKDSLSKADQLTPGLQAYTVPVNLRLSSQSLVSPLGRYKLKTGMTVRATFKLRSVSVFRRLFDATSTILSPQ